ncbi:phosphate ABC transporter permease subunit PstC [Adhaeribacter sp. BT258]|uniref:Phosphate transport system permease protein n=1 Tax=Adhaeribacter terrigena TaxID=2793070 RepID=A0ABS1C1V5_9BACT|nr:phosphate ABC transporter permease subunit PstC [Adhaeribacter terrigena]MBK0403367.1 phosphate ABC transporter permease subunit PstC [Adhaeribacter terrigena]
MKRYFHNFGERIIEGILTLSGAVTSLTVVLIVVFLFKEGLGIFSQQPIAEGGVIAVNNQNPVKQLSAKEVKEIFDENIKNWKEIGGQDAPIKTFRLDDITDYYSEEQLGKDFELLPQRLSELVSKEPNIIAFFPDEYLSKDFQGHQIKLENISAGDFLGGTEWYPTISPAVQMGVLPLILGTLWVSLGAILIALPLGLATSIYLAEIASKRVRNTMKPVIELLAGIPSVVYGFFGLVVLVPLIQEMFGLPVGETALAGSIILGIMALPTIISVSDDAMRTTPRAMKEASLALGATKWQTIYKVVIPYSISGISTAAILGIGRAIGETMAVLMVTGNASVIPTTFLEPVRTIPATIAAELGEAPQGGIHFQALFALGCILFLMTLIINVSVDLVSAKKKENR